MCTLLCMALARINVACFATGATVCIFISMHQLNTFELSGTYVYLEIHIDKEKYVLFMLK